MAKPNETVTERLNKVADKLEKKKKIPKSKDGKTLREALERVEKAV